MADNLTRQQRRRCMTRIRSKDTTPERLVRSLVHRLGYRYRLHVRQLPGSPDLVFANRKKVIFVHGCFWHRHRCRLGRPLPKTHVGYWRPKLDGNKERDRKHRQRLSELGWRILTVWECQTRPKKADWVAQRVIAFLEG